MTTNPINSSGGRTQLAGRLAMGLAAAFVGLLVLLHFLEPEFDPAWRMISEYELGRFGWLMRLAFFCWGGSLLAALAGLWPALRTTSGRIARGWLVILGVALFGAGIFATNAITDNVQSTTNTLHTLCGVLVILTFPMAASLVTRSVRRHPDWAAAHRGLWWLTLLVWLGLLAYFGSIIISGVLNPDAGRVGPHVLQGWPNRAMVVIYNLWLIYVGRHLMQQGSNRPS